MKETTLCYILKNDQVLMLHRIKKHNDLNQGYWIGVGGKFEDSESPDECMMREVKEETGLTVTEWKYRAIVTFVSDRYETEYMHLFLITDFCGELKECDEGDLEWIPREKLMDLPHWKGDRIFMSLIWRDDYHFYSLKLHYDKNNELLSAKLDGKPCLVTDRLVYIPWTDEDAERLYLLARDPEVGPNAGWEPHIDVEDSRQVIKSFLSRQDTFAVYEYHEGNLIGCVRLGANSFDTDSELKDGDICYWVGHQYWNNGYATEMAREMLRLGFEERELDRVFSSYYPWNHGSERVQEKCGFQYFKTILDKERKVHNNRPSVIINVITKEQWETSKS